MRSVLLACVCAIAAVGVVAQDGGPTIVLEPRIGCGYVIETCSPAARRAGCVERVTSYCPQQPTGYRGRLPNRGR